MTAFPKGRGVWRNDERAGKLVSDDPIVVLCYTSESAIEHHAKELRDFLVETGTGSNQGAVGFVIDRCYLEISLPEWEEQNGKEH